jgi:hypothetical protein
METEMARSMSPTVLTLEIDAATKGTKGMLFSVTIIKDRN